MVTVFALTLLCRQGHPEVVKYLHGLGLSLEATDNDGDTPLHNAARYGYVPCTMPMNTNNFSKFTHCVHGGVSR